MRKLVWFTENSKKGWISTTIFEEVKSYVTARSVAEHYGLKVKRTGVACCPFHDDHHPSMKIDKTYICFACGAKGDAINYVSDLYHLDPYPAACKIIEDFSLPIAIGKRSKREMSTARIEYQKTQREKRLQKSRKDRFREWQLYTIEQLRSCIQDINLIEKDVLKYFGENFMESDDFMKLINAKSIMEYWLDQLCSFQEKDVLLMFIHDRKEVDAFASKISGIIGRIKSPGKSDP